MNVKHIAATLAILGSASFSLTGCKKGTEGTEVPTGGEEKKADGSCGANKDGSCGGKDGSCSGKTGEGGDAAGGDAEKPAETPPAG